MAKQSMVLFRITRFGAKTLFQSREHVPRGCCESETKPAITKLELTKRKVAHSYFEAEITHREGLAIEGFWHRQRIHEVVLESLLNAYYSLERKVLIIEAPHAVASAAVSRLNKDCGQDIRLAPLQLDFNSLLQAAPALSVLGAWASSPQEPIRSRAAFSGEDLQKQSDFTRIKSAGKLSNLSLSLIFKGEDLRVNVSRCCAAFFLKPVDLEVGLQFMEYLAAFEEERRTPRRGRAKATASGG